MRTFPSLTALYRVLRAAEADTGGGEPAPAPEPAEPAGEQTEGGESQPAPEPPLAAEGEPAGDVVDEEEPAPKRVPWYNKRIDTLTAQKNAADERAANLERDAREAREKVTAYEALYGKQDAAPADPAPAERPSGAQPAITEKDIEAEVARRANLRALDSKLEATFDEQVAKRGDEFKQRAARAGEAFGEELKTRIDFFQALSDLPNGGDVYHELAGNLDHLGDVLQMTPIKLGMELQRLSIKAGAKPGGPAVSKTPAPITPIDANLHAEPDLDKVDMAEYDRTRQKQREERMAARGR